MSGQSIVDAENICWYCGKRAANPELAYEILMYKDEQRTAVSHKRTQVSWQEKKILVPRCSHCAQVHKGFNKAMAVGLGAVFLSILLVGLTFSITENYSIQVVAVVLAVLLSLGGMIGGGVWNGKVHKREGVKIISSANQKYPEVNTCKEQGWKFGIPPTRGGVWETK